MKIVINKCWGGFGLSKICMDELIKREHPIACQYMNDLAESFKKDMEFYSKKGWSYDPYKQHYYPDIPRNDPILIDVIEKLGTDVCGTDLSNLSIVEIPDDIDWEIDNYDGMESIHEKHRVWV